MPPNLRPCPACAELVFLNTCVCPHCGTAKVCRNTTLPRTALLLGLSLTAAGCNWKGQADYSASGTSDWHDDDDDDDGINTRLIDYDGDGFNEAQGDCDDTDATIYPTAPEVPGDGIDSNCNGDDNPAATDDYDEDGVTVGDGDCNDLDPAVFPDAEETPGDGVDSNCDGEDDT